jgi:hypothetical protein
MAMKIELHQIPIRELVKDYINSDEEGVTAYGSRLNIRPKYQREFVYKDAQRDAVISTVRKGFPLNVMYWVKTGADTYEVLDGQQRTISICEYVTGRFSINHLLFSNLQSDEQEQILNYEVMVYFCSEGTDSEKLGWFEIINIAGEVLTKQELRNTVYTGPWLTDAKWHFSKTGCAASKMASNLLTGSPIRQEYLETALDWISNGQIEKYMSEHQNSPTANDLWIYFQSVITWVNGTFPNYRKEMKGIDWGDLHRRFGAAGLNLDPKALEAEITRLMIDDDVTNKRGIYAYILDKDERHLNIRAFSEAMKRAAYERQGGLCKQCGKSFAIAEMEGDHIDPWHSGGKTNAENCQMLCKACNRRKSGK